MANGRCRNHGGASLVGPAHPNWKDGRHSKYVPKNLLQTYERGVNDPNLVELRDELALVDARVVQLLEAIGQTGNVRLWKEARAKFDAFKTAGGKGDQAVGTARIALQELDQVLAAGLTAAATWDELREMLDLRRRLSDSETKRLKDLNQLISATAALSLMAQLVEVVKVHVTDRHALAAITQQFLRLTARGSGDAPAT